MLNILITNDDGINSDGLRRLVSAAKKFGRVFVAAPDRQCSANSHHILLREYIEVRRDDSFGEDVKAYSVSGFPADCVRLGLLGLFEEKMDVVLSGINHGYNCGSDLQYSGTIAAALEGTQKGVHSIAVSEGAHGLTEVTDRYLEEMLREYLFKKLEYNQIWNINFPECSLAEFKGILTDRRACRKSFYEDVYVPKEQEDGSIRFYLGGGYNPVLEEGSDVKACYEGYISVGIIENVDSPRER